MLAAAVGAAALAVSERSRNLDAAPPGPGERPSPSRSRLVVRAAFLESMIAQHESALGLATVGLGRAEREELRELARMTVRRRSDELDRLRSLRREPYESVVVPYVRPPAQLGLTEDDLGRPLEPSRVVRGPLELAGRFDRAFIDVLVRHDLGSIRIAAATAARIRSGPVARLARAILAAETCEVRALNRLRTRWHGFPSPAGEPPTRSTDQVACRADGSAVTGPS